MAVRTGLSNHNLSFLANFLAFLGRPFFWLLSYFFIFLLLLSHFLKIILKEIGAGVLYFLKTSFLLLGNFFNFLPIIKLSLLLKSGFKKFRLKLSRTVMAPFVIWKKVIFFTFFFFLIASMALFFYIQILKDLPQPDKLINRKQPITTKIYDRNGILLYKIYRNQNRSLVKLEEIPLSLRQATIAIEDAEFYSHRGLSFKGIFRSLAKLVKEGRLQGGSTITQQLVKNALLTPERTLKRKIKEVILALQVEARFSKDEILQMYFNEVGYGGSAYGVEEASQLYFRKSVKDLTLSEAALLAGLPASPTTYSPFGAQPEMAKRRQELVLHRMVQEGFLTSSQAGEAVAVDIYLAPQKTDILAPHFVMFVKQILVEKFGEKMVEEGGLEVVTSLDMEVQKKAENIVKTEIEKLAPLHIGNGAALVTNPKNGEILAMVGSKDYFDNENQGNFNVTTATRQPGSSIKPITYSLALTSGFTAATILVDSPVTYHLAGQPPYSPKNYDGRYHGNIPLRTALASSYNVPAVKVLSSLGVNRLIEQGQKMGITTWEDRSRFGLSLTLGGGEVKMTDMTVAYGTLANLGTKVTLNPLLKVKNYEGEDLLNKEKGKEEEKVISEGIAYILTDILSDNGARTPAFGPNSVLNIPGKKVAVKTGTSNDLKDNWIIGWTPSFLTAVWVGNNDSSPMSYVASGITGASPIWRQITDFLLTKYPYEEVSQPAGLVKVEICQTTDTLPCSLCPSKRTELFLDGTQPKFACKDEEVEKFSKKDGNGRPL